jgi:hypothetical protein
MLTAAAASTEFEWGAASILIGIFRPSTLLFLAPRSPHLPACGAGAGDPSSAEQAAGENGKC